MSKPATIYRLNHQPFDPTDNIQEFVDISDMWNLVDDADPQEIISVIPAGDPVRASVIDNNEDPFTVIKSQQLTISLHSDNPVSMNSFLTGADTGFGDGPGPDNRWAVHNYITINGGSALTLFRGFLVLDDLSEPFMPEPNEVVLTANDAMGLLKEIPITDLEGVALKGEYKLSELITFCLAKTGMALQIKAAFNIKLTGFIDPINTPNANDQHLFSTNWLNSKSFENSDGTFMSCYEVLQRILGEEACVFQRQGAWWIVRVDEIQNAVAGMYVTTFDSDGVFVSNDGLKNFDKSVGKDAPYTITFSKEQTKVLPTRNNKSVTITYPYEIPDYPENRDFDKGDLTLTVSPTDKHYNTDAWVPFNSAALADAAPTVTIYTRRIFVNDYETERYVVIPSNGDFNFIMSEPIPVGVKDKFVLGLERRLSSDVGGSGFYRDLHVQVRLYGSDGTFWTHQSKTSASNEKKWVACTSTFRTNQKFFAIEGDVINDLTEAVELYDGESAEIPVGGNIRILLYQSSLYGATKDTYFSGLSFDYLPFINGSYRKYVSQSQKVEQPEDFKAVRDVSVYMSDAPRPGIKGALLNPLLYVEVYNGSVTFVNGTTFQVAGYKLGVFRIGQRLNITGPVSNTFTARVTGVSYSLIGTLTIVTVDHATVNETVAAKIDELTFELSDQFYDASLYPAGPPDSSYLQPYSQLQVFDVWNQFVYDRRIFQATLQGMDLAVVDTGGLADNAHLVHKWILTDPTLDTINRIFMLLTFDGSRRLGEWTGTMREVDNANRPKLFFNRTFKYNT